MKPTIRERTKSYGIWILLFIIAMIVMWCGFMGRVAILAAIAVLPDNVAVVNQGS